MLTSLFISNFRIFSQLEINSLRRVNLLVGKNNSGKSCFLEAVQVYAAKGHPATLYGIVSSRDEQWESVIAEQNQNTVRDINEPLGYLFHGYHLPDIGGNPIEIGPVEDKSKRLYIKAGAFQVTEDEEGRRIRVPVDQESMKNELMDIQTALESVQGGERCYYISLNSPFHRKTVHSQPKDFNYHFQIVPTRNIDDDKISVLWDNINLTDLEEEVVSCLRLIDPNIAGIALVGDASDRFRSRKRIPIVRCKGMNERLPLKTMGDGITRLFHIILALVNAKNGFLLIDEFENGIHWKVQPKLWESIVRLAEKLNVQVIATTHSRDCITGFYEVWKSNPSLCAFYRLASAHDFGSKITAYSCESLSDAIASDVEVR
ncbi:MAG: ATP/GTP-binding protein [Desulfococcaceae bacterium]